MSLLKVKQDDVGFTLLIPVGFRTAACYSFNLTREPK